MPLRAGRKPAARRRPEAEGEAGRSRRGPRWPAALMVAVLTLAVFWPVIDNQFVNWDDDQNFLQNPNFRGLGAANLRWMFTTFHLGHYQPLTWITLGFDYVIWGLNPKGYHLTNLLLHAVNAAVFYFVALRLLGGKVWAASGAALFFALHPLRVESVAWASERRDVLAGLFYLLSALAYLRAHQEGPRRRWLAVSVTAFGAALLSKVITVSLPVVFLALDFYPLRRLRGGWREWLTTEARRVWAEKLPYAALAAAAAWAAFALQKAGVSGFAEHVAARPGLRAGLSLYGVAVYLWKTIVPYPLYQQYVMTAGLSPWDKRILLGAAVAVAITALAVAWRRRFPAAVTVWACYAVSLLPVLSIARVDPQQYVADHHTYLATLGLALLAGAGVGALPARLAGGLGVAVLLALSALTRQQIEVWRDPVSLWTRTLAGSPDSVVAHNNLGEALADQGRYAEAVPHFLRAIQIKPNHAHAHYNLGLAALREGKLAEAAGRFEQAVRVEPAFAAAHNDLANTYAALGRLEAALEHYRTALRLQPGFAEAHYNLGNLLYRQRQFAQAISHYRQALLLNPSHAEAHNNWGVALDALGRAAEAVEHYRQALALDPGNADAHNNLGVDLEAAGKIDEALAHYQEALRLNPSHGDARANLARARSKR
ncbi:MAG: tetratricopeptide repeat protein [Acidobacteria bacterium]|nr:tetratricopeptide repeat protein [Acidobacteriota bacterium]